MKLVIKRIPDLIRKAKGTSKEILQEPDPKVHEIHRTLYLQETTRSQFVYASYYTKVDPTFFGFLKHLPFIQGYVLQSNLIYNRGVLPLQRRAFRFFHRSLMGYFCGLQEFRTPPTIKALGRQYSLQYSPKYLTYDSAQAIWFFPNLDLIIYKHFDVCLVKYKERFFFTSSFQLCYVLDKYMAAKIKGEKADIMVLLQHYQDTSNPMSKIYASQFEAPNYMRPVESSTFMRLNYHLFK